MAKRNSKNNKLSFISSIGRHNTGSLGNDLKLNDINKVSKKRKIESKDFSKIDSSLGLVRKVFEQSGIKFNSGLKVKLVETGASLLINELSKNSTMASMNLVSSIGTKTAKYTKTTSHTGSPTSSRLKSMINNPTIDYNEKVLSSSDKDYQQHKKRKNLNLNIGFNQKGFSFFTEDTFISVKQFIDFFNRDARIKRNLEKTKNGKINVFGCVFKTVNQFKIINTFDHYNVAVSIYLIKINDLDDDVRTLLYEITNNKFDTITKPKQDVGDILSETVSETGEILGDKNLRGKDKFKKTAQKVGAKALKKAKETLKKQIEIEIDKRINNKSEKDNYSKRGSPYGKLNEDDQYSDPNLTDIENKFSINFLTSLRCKLTDSIQFNDRARIVHEWNRVLGPGDAWEFNLHCHFGKGIHLNYLYDLEYENPNHPANYIFAMSYVGDRKSSVTRKKDKDLFFGMSPSKLHIEFQHKLCYLTELKNDEEIPAVYRKKHREEDFEENSEFEQTFCPDREPSFNINYNDISLINDEPPKKGEREKKFNMNYGTTLNPVENNMNLLDQIAEKFSEANFETKDLTEEDAKFNPTITMDPAWKADPDWHQDEDHSNDSENLADDEQIDLDKNED